MQLIGGNSKVYFKNTSFFDVDFQPYSRFSRKNARQPNVDQRKSCSPNCQEYFFLSISAKKIAV